MRLLFTLHAVPDDRGAYPCDTAHGEQTSSSLRRPGVLPPARHVLARGQTDLVDTADIAFLVMVHASFQLTVTILVHPALSRVPADRWPNEHGRHSRSITPLVGIVYLPLAVTVLWLLASTGPAGRTPGPCWLSRSRL